MHSGGEERSLSSAEAGLVPTNCVFAQLLASKLSCMYGCLCKQGVLRCWLGAYPIHMVPFFPSLLRKGCEKNNIHKLPSFSDVSFSKWEAVNTNSDLLALLPLAVIHNAVV